MSWLPHLTCNLSASLRISCKFLITTFEKKLFSYSLPVPYSLLAPVSRNISTGLSFTDNFTRFCFPVEPIRVFYSFSVKLTWYWPIFTNSFFCWLGRWNIASQIFLWLLQCLLWHIFTATFYNATISTSFKYIYISSLTINTILRLTMTAD